MFAPVRAAAAAAKPAAALLLRLGVGLVYGWLGGGRPDGSKQILVSIFDLHSLGIIDTPLGQIQGCLCSVYHPNISNLLHEGIALHQSTPVIDLPVLPHCQAIAHENYPVGVLHGDCLITGERRTA